MAIKFNTLVKEGTNQFVPDVSLGFADEGAEDYFKRVGWAEDTDEEPTHTYPEGTIEIDPDTIIAATGERVFVQPEDSVVTGG